MTKNYILALCTLTLVTCVGERDYQSPPAKECEVTVAFWNDFDMGDKNVYTLTFDIIENTGADRTAIIKVDAGRMKQAIRIAQS